jgi:hypothetical protein
METVGKYEETENVDAVIVFVLFNEVTIKDSG